LFGLTSTPPAKKSNAAAEALGRSRGGFSTKVYVAVDALGNPLRILLRPGQKADISEAEALIEGYRFGALIADKGFDSNDFIEQVESLEAVVVIPPRKNRLVQRDIDRNLYADRNKIERFFGRIKHYRRIATRYEKTARNYRSFLHLASIITWLL
jgi:transposase